MVELTVGALAKRTGLTVRTLHHYDQIRLLSPSGRTEAGYRLYSDADVRRLVLCTGKIYYDLAARREQVGAAHTAIARVERLYPLPVSELRAELARYPGLESVTWVQEEPANMGGWPTFALKLPRVLDREVGVVSLPASSAPAAGSAKKHAATHREIIETAIPSGQ